MKKRKAEEGTLEPVRRGVSSGDRLSDLPDDVLGHILAFLPTPQAVLTSQLSRRVWPAHVRSLNLSVRGCVTRGVGPRLGALCREALARFPAAFGFRLTDLELPAAFGRFTELSLSRVRTPAGTPPFHDFVSSCCPRLARLRLCCVRGEAMRRLALRSDALEALDLDCVDQLERLDVVAANLRSLTVRSCFRFPRKDAETEAVVSAPRVEAVCWYRSSL